MSIVAKSQHKNGASTNRPAYLAAFLRDAHRLLARGYARMTPADLVNTEEEVVTEELVVAINQAIEAPGAEAWMQRYYVVDDVRVRHPKRRGKKRPRVDVEITNTTVGHRPRLHFEAKRLGRCHAVGEYVGRKGLGCIIEADYAREQDDAGMLGYVQSGTCDEWVPKIETKLFDDEIAHQLVAGSVWETSNLTPELSHVFQTHHNRPSLGRPVNVYHTLLLFC